MVGLGFDELVAAHQVVAGDEGAGSGHLGIAALTALASHGDEHRVGMGRTELGQRLDGDGQPLQRLDATDEQQHRVVAQTQRGASPAPVARREEGVVDAGWDDLDAARIGAAQLHQLGGLGRAVGEDGIGAGDDLGLGLHPPVRFGIAGVGLDPSEGVERRDERHM